MKRAPVSVLAGFAWLFMQMLGTRGVQFLSQLAIAWFLFPGDMGRVGLAFSITGMAGALFSFGVTDVLLQRSKSMSLWARDAFWANEAFAVAGALCAVATAPVMDSLRGTDVLPLVSVAALSMPLDALGAIPQTLLRARLDFRLLATVGLAETLAMQGLTVLCAWKGLGAMSLVLPGPLVVACRVAVLWRASGLRVGRPRIARWRYLAKGSLNVQGSRILVTLVAQGDYLVLSSMASEAVVGLYYFAFKVAAQPLFALGGSVNGVLFPALVRLSGDAAGQARAAFRVAHVLNIVIMPVCFMQAALADDALALLFPGRWGAAAPMLQVLSVGLAFDGASWAAGTLMGARGEFARSFRISLACACVFLVAALVGCGVGGGIGVSFALAGFYVTAVPVIACSVMTGHGISKSDVLGAIFGTAALAAGSVCAVTWSVSMMDLAPLSRILASLSLFVPVYAMAVRFAFPDVSAELTTRLVRAVGSRCRRGMPGRATARLA